MSRFKNLTFSKVNFFNKFIALFYCGATMKLYLFINKINKYEKEINFCF